MFFNKLSRAGLVLLSCFFFFSVVSAAPLFVRDYGTTPPDTDIPRHLTSSDTATGIIHHISAADQSNQITPHSNPPSIFRRDGGDLQFIFPARRSIKSKFKAAFRKMGSGIKHIGKTVAHFVEVNKNKIAKVGLKPLSKGLEIASKFTNQASNRIHANLGGNLGKAMAGMDKAEHIAGYLRR